MEIGIGTTGLCNMKCPHCYSRKYDGHFITYDDAYKLLGIFDITSVNFGTGENILNPHFKSIVKLFYENNIKMSLTTNGFTVAKLEDEYLKLFNDIDFSLEFPERNLQNNYRGQGSWELIIDGIEKCKSLNIPVSIACALMKKNANYMRGFRELMYTYNCFLRINIIKCGEFMTEPFDEYDLNYEDFWNVFEQLFSEFFLLSCSEPILCVAIGRYKELKGSPCGQEALRIQPNGSILPCVYWPISDYNFKQEQINIDNLKKSESFLNIGKIPSFCLEKNCLFVPYCKGGCASRRILTSDIDLPDKYCPVYNNRDFPVLKYKESAEQIDLVHSSYLCTVILGLEGCD